MLRVMSYTPTIGLEIHAELKTRTKMFCDSPNDPEEMRPNVNICPICLAHPGTLPTINEDAVLQVLRVGKALDSKLADYSEFDRKSYFYPDIPKGYQISQYEYPLVAGGTLAGVDITRVHLEEDTARSIHATGKSLVDFNRAGVPLMELVTEPVIHDAETAGVFAKELQLLLRTLGASDANLEKGEMRIEANISVSKEEGKLGTKVEVKNLNSFRSVERAIAYEVKRQSELLDSGGGVLQETRGWNEGKEETFRQRTKEGSADYRYFPEPDLPKMIRSGYPAFSDEALEKSLPELPKVRRARYESFGIPKESVESLVSDSKRNTFFDSVLVELGSDSEHAKRAANYVVSDLAGIFAASGIESYENVTPASFAKLMRMADKGELSSRGAKDVLLVLATEGGDAEEIAKAKGLLQVNDTGALTGIVKKVIAENSSVAQDYRGGKETALQFLLGQSMKASKGAGNPTVLKELLMKELAS